jgi:sugar phosphate isomerase/epimerase
MKSDFHRLERAGLCFLAAACLAGALSGCPAQSPEKTGATGTSRATIAERAACSSLCQAKQPAEKALPAVAAMGFRWVDLSCLSWAPHVSIEALVGDFEKEAARVESLLAASSLGVANLTFDAVEIRPFDRYRKEFEAVVKLAVRLKTRLINLMAPSLNADWKDQVEELRVLQEIAARSGVTLTVETHTNQVTERPDVAVKLCKEVPGLGLTLDPSHYYAGPHQGGSFDELYPLARGTGLRAGGMSWEKVQLPWGEGPIDFALVVRKLEAAGYKGYYAAEYIEGFNQVDALAESRKFLEWVRKNF